MFDFLFVNHFDVLRNAAAIGFVAWLTWLVARHGVTWVWTKVQSAWSSAQGDVSGLVARVEALEAKVGTATIVTAPTGHTGHTGPTGAPAPTGHTGPTGPAGAPAPVVKTA
jgi:hypothetical protein